MTSIATMDIDEFRYEFDDKPKYIFSIHIRYQQQNGKKYKTIVDGLRYPLKGIRNILSGMKTIFACGGEYKAIDNDELDSRYVIILSGDKREDVRNYLVSFLKLNRDSIHIY